ncbi:MAG: exodeoxyribonuclease VII small subunit [Chlorobi bacterium]|nr:exodeoxyribonuclease VII small subunit [Chlorobiota bacterium]
MTKPTLTYNKAIEEIESILEKIETDELDVDVLSKNVKRVAELIKFCKTKLHKTEEEVQKIIDEMEN